MMSSYLPHALASEHRAVLLAQAEHDRFAASARRSNGRSRSARRRALGLGRLRMPALREA